MTSYRSHREALVAKYHHTALAARNMALKAQDEDAKARWLAHAAEWEALAEEAEKAIGGDDKT